MVAEVAHEERRARPGRHGSHQRAKERGAERLHTQMGMMKPYKLGCGCGQDDRQGDQEGEARGSLVAYAAQQASRYGGAGA